MLAPAWETAEAFLEHYANTHSELHYGARIANKALVWARERLLQFVNADPPRISQLFLGL